MKKVISLILTVCLTFIFAGCADSPSDAGGNSNSYSYTYDDTSYNNEYTYDDGNYENPTIQYISDRNVQYDTANKHHIVFFGLQDASNTYVSSSGKASITITDSSNTIIFQQDINFSSDDFTDWTNQSWDSSRYLCGLYIKDSDLQGSASSSGTLSLKVTLDDGTWFDALTMAIYDLPSISVKINLPSIPSTHEDISYSSYTSTVQVSKLEYKSEVIYDGTATVQFDVILKLVSKNAYKNESSSVSVGYKLYDSDGIVVDSGHIYSNPLAIGESSKNTFTVFDLDPRDTYTLKFENAS